MRPVIVDSTVNYERLEFKLRTDDGWDPSPARVWFANEQHARPYTRGTLKISPAITQLITCNADHLPPTFTLDYVRLRALQARFEALMHQASCRWTFEEIVQSLGSRQSIPMFAYHDLYHRVAIITSDEEASRKPFEQTSNVALEIVRAAYKLCKISKLPSTGDIKFSESSLDQARDVETKVYQNLRSYLAEDLQYLVEDEVLNIENLTPMQISNRYHSPGAFIAPRSRQITVEMEMLQMAQMIAHISVLHWRVWAPLLYEVSETPNNESIDKETQF